MLVYWPLSASLGPSGLFLITFVSSIHSLSEYGRERVKYSGILTEVESNRYWEASEYEVWFEL